jgi:hypothetical protein
MQFVVNSEPVGKTDGTQGLEKVRYLRKWITWVAGLIGLCWLGNVRAATPETSFVRERELVVYDGSSPEIRGLAGTSLGCAGGGSSRLDRCSDPDSQRTRVSPRSLRWGRRFSRWPVPVLSNLG